MYATLATIQSKCNPGKQCDGIKSLSATALVYDVVPVLLSGVSSIYASTSSSSSSFSYYPTAHHSLPLRPLSLSLAYPLLSVPLTLPYSPYLPNLPISLSIPSLDPLYGLPLLAQFAEPYLPHLVHVLSFQIHFDLVKEWRHR